MMIRLGAITYNFLMELILAILALFLIYYIPLDLFPPLLYFMGISLGGFISCALLLMKFPKIGQWLYLIAVLPLLLFLGSFTSMPLIQIGMIGLLIFWRGVSLNNRKKSSGSNTIFLFLFLLTGVSLTLFAGTSDYPQQNVIISLFFIEIMLVLIGLFVSKWSTINENRGKFFLYYGGFLAGAALIGVMVTYGLKLTKLIVSGILMLVAYILTFALRVGYFIADLFKSDRPPFRSTAIELEDEPENKYYRNIQMLKANPDWMTYVLIALIIIIAFYIYKKRKRSIPVGDNASMLQISEDVSRARGGFLFKMRARPPKDQVRSEIFFLERFAGKMKLGRKPFESLTEWWARIGITESGQLSKTYENVRYGEIPSTADDLSKVKAEITQIKQQFKEKA